MRHFNLCVLPAGVALLLAAASGSAARGQQDGLLVDGVDPAPAPLRQAWSRYRDSATLQLLGWLADGSLLVGTPGAGGLQAARVASPSEAPEVLGGGAGRVTDAAAHPFEAGRLALRSVDGQGQAGFHVSGYAGAPQPLAGVAAGPGAPLWAHGGRRLAYTRQRGDGGFDVLVAEVPAADAGPAPQAQRIVADGGRWQVLDWSRDDGALLLRCELAQDDARLAIADVASGALTPVDAPAGRTALRMRVPAARFTPDGNAVLYLRDDGEDGFVRLKSAARDGSLPRPLTAPMLHDVERFDVSADGRYLAYVWSEAGYSHLSVIDQRTRAPVPLPPGLPAGVISGLRFDRSGMRLALEVSTSTTPPEIDVIDLAVPSVTRWVQGVAPGGTLQPAQRLRFRTWDRVGGRARELTAFLYAPRGPGPHPVLVLLHGGPRGEFRPGYEPWLQFLVNELGMAVVAPNLRGSGGAGGAFAALADGALREDAIRDFGSLLVWIGAQPSLDAARIAVMGSGQGGQQALAALAAYGERLRGAVVIDPPADAQSMGHAAALLRPALLAHLGSNVPGRLSDAEQLLWRMRAKRREAAYLAVDYGRCAPDCRAAEGMALAAVGGYLQGLLGPSPAPLPLSETREP
ncbi:MAG: alpha/beta fold hydrolase [Gammaproteobacteria bacterium]|nr:alpha/beta fold hydrolase [Gammaproteobacteria bacterium]